MDREIELRFTGDLAEALADELEASAADIEIRDLDFEQRVEAAARDVVAQLPASGTRRKELERIRALLGELLDLESTNPLRRRRADIDRLIRTPPRSLSDDLVSDVALGLTAILLRDGGASVVYEVAQDERRWTKDTTSWLTWDQLFGSSEPPGLSDFLAGKAPSDLDLAGTRRRLTTLARARLADMQVHRERTARRKQNLKELSRILFFLVFALATATFAVSVATGAAPLRTPLALLAGLLGAALSGTIKARDSLVRSSDIEAFWDALPAQLLVGAAAALTLIVLLDSKLVTIAGLDLGSWQGAVAVGFLAGFSEPYFLGTVRRVATLGEGSASDKGT